MKIRRSEVSSWVHCHELCRREEEVELMIVPEKGVVRRAGRTNRGLCGVHKQAPGKVNVDLYAGKHELHG